MPVVLTMVCVAVVVVVVAAVDVHGDDDDDAGVVGAVGDPVACHGYGRGCVTHDLLFAGQVQVVYWAQVEDGCLARHRETWTHVPESAGSYDGGWTLLVRSGGWS